ncbi:hypothetical protein IQ235_02205 [Oscillatoriales cyanobacterium LEGE 11467]|uniref:Uncharacterized protein n=1 Tax=Zarconia navalis LEGE 11467 TaxID=1828826 RepID=A0A928Z7E8_9CYAN|nr:hypothetical protein [Zarconia navalis]MBE9039608.1 hypothetical protein [Zarconia navalis LEGE 11467]
MALGRNQKLATFKCDRQIWDRFLARAAENGTSGAELCKWFVSAYVSGEIDPRQHLEDADVERLADGLDKRLAPIYRRLNEFNDRLGKSSEKVTILYP